MFSIQNIITAAIFAGSIGFTVLTVNPSQASQGNQYQKITSPPTEKCGAYGCGTYPPPDC